MKQLTIGKLAELTGVTADTLRYYEKMKLLKAEGRTSSGYRLYSPNTANVVRFIRGAKSLNFTLEEIRKLLALNTSDQTTCIDILKHTEGKIAEAEIKIKELKEIKRVLTDLVQRCPGDDTPVKACPIMDHIHKAKTVFALLLIAGMALAAPKAEAKPISYVGGIMAMQENDETGHTLSLDYTLTPDYAVGLYAKQEENGKKFDTIGPQFNTLIKRWNMPDGQANIFNMIGAGDSHYHGDDDFSAWSSFLADYESRRIFASAEARFMYADHIETSEWQRARIGFAPYLANYDDLNTWFMVQFDHHPAKDQTDVVTPLVRFFYQTALVEAGYSSNHHLMLNWVYQF